MLVRISFVVNHRIPPHTTTFLRQGCQVSPNWSFSFAGGWKAIGPPMHGLAESSWPECNRSGSGGGVICEVCCNRSPDAQPGIFSGRTGATAVPSFTKINIHSFNLWFKLSFLTCQLPNSSAYALYLGLINYLQYGAMLSPCLVLSK